jgi:hypothetical protein
MTTRTSPSRSASGTSPTSEPSSSRSRRGLPVTTPGRPEPPGRVRAANNPACRPATGTPRPHHPHRPRPVVRGGRASTSTPGARRARRRHPRPRRPRLPGLRPLPREPRDVRPAPRPHRAEHRRHPLPSAKPVTQGDTRVTLHPAGHILGSAQVRVEDTKKGSANRRHLVRLGRLQDRPRSHRRALRARPLRHLHQRDDLRPADLPLARPRAGRPRDQRWWRANAGPGAPPCCSPTRSARPSASSACSTPPSAHRRPRVDPQAQRGLRTARRQPPDRRHATKTAPELKNGGVIVAPPSASSGPWIRRSRAPRASASRWSAGGCASGDADAGSPLDHGFVLSDHADWQGLLDTIERNRRTRVGLTHGSASVMARYLAEHEGLDAFVVPTRYTGGRRRPPIPRRKQRRRGSDEDAPLPADSNISSPVADGGGGIASDGWVGGGSPIISGGHPMSLRRFTRLYLDLDATSSTTEKVALLRPSSATTIPARSRFRRRQGLGPRPPHRQPPQARHQHRRPQGPRPRMTGTPKWLLDACHESVGDLSETIALLLPDARAADSAATRGEPLHDTIEHRVLPLIGHHQRRRRNRRSSATRGRMDADERFVYHKLIRGGFRVGVQKKLVSRALAAVAGVDDKVMAQRLVATTEPTPEAYRAVLSGEVSAERALAPLPFYLATPLDEGSPARTPVPEAGRHRPAWHAEWKYDGIRAQLVRRDGQTAVWSRGEELITHQFPELVAAATTLPRDAVLDGEVLIWTPTTPTRPALRRTPDPPEPQGRALPADGPVRDHPPRDARLRPARTRRRRPPRPPAQPSGAPCSSCCLSETNRAHDRHHPPLPARRGRIVGRPRRSPHRRAGTGASRA